MPGVTLKIIQPSENMFQEDKENRSGGRETPLDTQNGLALPSKKHTAWDWWFLDPEKWNSLRGRERFCGTPKK
jgi:hypothetical protein